MPMYVNGEERFNSSTNGAKRKEDKKDKQRKISEEKW